jgi:hypothetical protein
MIINKSNGMYGFALNNRPIPDASHVEIASTISRLFKVIMQGNIKEAELHIFQQIRVSVHEMGRRVMDQGAKRRDVTDLCAETINIPQQIINGVFPELAKRKKLWLGCFAADCFDKVRHEILVDMLFVNGKKLALWIVKGE